MGARHSGPRRASAGPSARHNACSDSQAIDKPLVGDPGNASSRKLLRLLGVSGMPSRSKLSRRIEVRRSRLGARVNPDARLCRRQDGKASSHCVPPRLSAQRSGDAHRLLQRPRDQPLPLEAAKANRIVSITPGIAGAAGRTLGQCVIHDNHEQRRAEDWIHGNHELHELHESKRQSFRPFQSCDSWFGAISKTWHSRLDFEFGFSGGRGLRRTIDRRLNS